MTAPIHHTSRPRHSAGHTAGEPARDAAGRASDGTIGGRRGVLQQVWRQLPFFVWLVALWMLLWGQFTVVAFVTGVIAAVAVTRVFRLPPVELSGRVNLWYGLIFVAHVPRGARARFAPGRLAGARLPASAGQLHHRGASADRRRPDHDAHRRDGLPHPRVDHHRGGSGSADPVSARDRRDARRRRSNDSGARSWAGRRRIVRAVGSRAQLEIIRRAEIDTPQQGGAPA